MVHIFLSPWPRGLRRGSVVARLLGLMVRIPQATWLSVCCDCCVLSGRGLCVGPITHPEESCRVNVVCLSAIVKPRSWGGPGPTRGCRAIKKYRTYCRETCYFMFEFPWIISLYYIKNQQDTTLTVLFISNCKITLHVSDAFCVHHEEY